MIPKTIQFFLNIHIKTIFIQFIFIKLLYYEKDANSYMKDSTAFLHTIFFTDYISGLTIFCYLTRAPLAFQIFHHLLGGGGGGVRTPPHLSRLLFVVDKNEKKRSKAHQK